MEADQVSGHTPGPWEWMDTSDHMSLKGLIAILGGTHYVCSDSGADPVVRSAEDGPNARLIAAAPDLLRAAQFSLDHDCCAPSCPAQKLIAAAIAKAEGK